MTKEYNISTKTWANAINSVSKLGYMDGAADGQTSAFQSSFDEGYRLGLNFGSSLGYKKACESLKEWKGLSQEFQDPRKINCQVCLDSTLLKHNILNLHNIQYEKNLK